MFLEDPIASASTSEGIPFADKAASEQQISESNYLAADVSYPAELTPKRSYHVHGIIGETLLKRITKFFKQLRDAQDPASALHAEFNKQVEFYKEHRRAIKEHKHVLSFETPVDVIKEGAVTIRKAALGIGEAGQNFVERASNLLSGKKGTVTVEVRTTHHTRFLPGLLAKNDLVKTWNLDETGNGCYNLTKEIEDFFHKALGEAFADSDYPWMNSNNRLVGLFEDKLLSSVNYGIRFMNAFWNGEQMVYGDGDGRNMGSFIIDTVIAHELGHGLTEKLTPNGVAYERDAGGINESLSDIFGITCSHSRSKLTIEHASAQGEWLIGKGMILHATGDALRNMKFPGTAYRDQAVLGDDVQLGFGPYSAWKNNPDQDPHCTSATGNLWFVTMCENLAKIHPGLHSYDLPLQIVFQTMPHLPYDATYPQWAALTLKVTAEKFGENSSEWKAVRDAWKAVEVPVPAKTTTNLAHAAAVAA